MIWLLLTRPRGTELWSVNGVFIDTGQSMSKEELPRRLAMHALMRESGEATDVRLVGMAIAGDIIDDDIKKRDPYWKE